MLRLHIPHSVIALPLEITFSLPKCAVQVHLSSACPSPAVLYDCGHQLAILDHCSHLLRNRLFNKVAFITDRHADIKSASFGSDDLGRSNTFFGEVDLARVGGVNEDRGDETNDLDSERRGRGDGKGRHNRIEENGCLCAVDWDGASMHQSVSDFSEPGRNSLHSPMLMALTFPLICTTHPLHPKIWMLWLISVLSITISWLFSWYS